MAHIYSVMSTVNGKLNTLFKDYCNEGRTNVLGSVPDFVVMSINRAIDTDTSPDILIDNNKTAQVSKPIFAGTGDDFNPIYMVVVNNISKPIIDKVPIIVDHKGSNGPGTAIVLGVPKLLFEETTDSATAAALLRQIYFGLLNTDNTIQYEASPAMISLYKSTKIKIQTYDLMMCITAICLMNINLRSWYFDTDASGNHIPIKPEDTLEAFSNKELSAEARTNLIRVMNKYGKTINELRVSIGNGKLLSVFMYDIKK